jgi:hypothetical protein
VHLRKIGVSQVHSIGVMTEASGERLDVVKRRVHESRVWADRKAAHAHEVDAFIDAAERELDAGDPR